MPPTFLPYNSSFLSITVLPTEAEGNRRPAMKGVLPNLAGGEDRGGVHDLYGDGSCKRHGVQAALEVAAQLRATLSTPSVGICS
jgi:hypothetical protein